MGNDPIDCPTSFTHEEIRTIRRDGSLELIPLILTGQFEIVEQVEETKFGSLGQCFSQNTEDTNRWISCPGTSPQLCLIPNILSRDMSPQLQPISKPEYQL